MLHNYKQSNKYCNKCISKMHTSDTFCLLAHFFDNMKVSQLSHVGSDRQNSGILFKTYLIVVTVYFHVDLQPHPSRR